MIIKKILAGGPIVLELAENCNNIGCCYQALEAYQKAVDYYQAALEHSSRHYQGTDQNRYSALTLYNLAVCQNPL